MCVFILCVCVCICVCMFVDTVCLYVLDVYIVTVYNFFCQDTGNRSVKGFFGVCICVSAWMCRSSVYCTCVFAARV